MTIVKISKQLENMVQGIVDHIAETEDGYYFKYKAVIKSYKNKELNIDLDEVVREQLEQAFANNLTDDYDKLEDRGHFTDYITLEVLLTPLEYFELVKNHQDLYINIEMNYFHANIKENINDRKPIVRNYRCLILDPEDLTKKYPIELLRPDEGDPIQEGHRSARLEVSLQLIDDKIYQIRHSKLNTILSGRDSTLTIEKTLHTIAMMFGISNVHIVTPDNTNGYKHIILSPPMGIDTIFEYIHDKYGVYHNGFNYYYTDDVLYIYPPYDTDQENINENINIYNIPEGHYSGLEAYHMIKGKNIHILSNSEVISKDLTEVGLENFGNGITHIRADRIIDKYIVVEENGSYIKEDNLINLEMTTNKSMGDQVLNTQYREPCVNTYKHASDIVKSNANLLLVKWFKAIPKSLYPGQKVYYHYDDEGKYSVKSGILEYVRYDIVPEDRVDDYYFSATAIMIIRLQTE